MDRQPNRPISDDSRAFLTLDHLGKLMINSSGFGGDPLVIYSGGETENTSATLLDTGNLVVSEVNSNGSIGRSLWESFDDPTDTLLPGMKLGVNHKTGCNWSLTSWLAEDDPASGAITLEWEPKTRRLVIKRRGVPYCSSGLQVSSSKNVSSFEYIHPTKGQDYIINTDAEGQYFTYSLDTEFDSLDQERSAWQLQYWGSIMDRSISITKMNFCYGYGMDDEGCETWNQPECRLWVAKRLSKNLESLHVWVLMVYRNLQPVFLITDQPLVLLIVEIFAGITVTVWAIVEKKELDLDASIGKEM